jgi:hypothetical protein
MLLAKYTSGTGCEVKFIKTVYKNEEDKKVIYIIKIQPHGACKQKVSSMNWITIPKPPFDYQVEFQVSKS